MDNFLNNKYTQIYYRIIERAQKRLKPSEYTEKHHIIPKCKPFFGKNTKENLVHLTFKEHWTCHHLLMKMVKGIKKAKMYYAFRRMGQLSKNHKRIINSNMFERIKIINRELCCGKNNPMYGKKNILSEESKKKISKSLLEINMVLEIKE